MRHSPVESLGRRAVVGDDLILTRLSSDAVGFIAPPKRTWRNLWGLNNKSGVTVCIPEDAHLRLSGKLPAKFVRQFPSGWCGSCRYGVELEGGSFLPLQNLPGGLRVEVLALPGEDAPRETGTELGPSPVAARRDVPISAAAGRIRDRIAGLD